jgi:hypothetical protein
LTTPIPFERAVVGGKDRWIICLSEWQLVPRGDEDGQDVDEFFAEVRKLCSAAAALNRDPAKWTRRPGRRSTSSTTNSTTLPSANVIATHSTSRTATKTATGRPASWYVEIHGFGRCEIQLLFPTPDSTDLGFRTAYLCSNRKQQLEADAEKKLASSRTARSVRNGRSVTAAAGQ